MQAEHLLSLGRKRVCVANSVHSCWVVDQRIAGLQDTLLKAGAPKPLYMNLPFEARPIMDGPAGVHDFIRAFMLKNKDKMDAVVGTGDEVAMTVMGIANSLMLDFRTWIVPRFVYVTGEHFEGDDLTDEDVRMRVVRLLDDWQRAITGLSPAAPLTPDD